MQHVLHMHVLIVERKRFDIQVSRYMYINYTLNKSLSHTYFIY